MNRRGMRRAALVLGMTLLLGGLQACGGGEKEPRGGAGESADTSGATPSEPATPTQTITGQPAGHATPDVDVELTAPGSTLALGETATVADQRGKAPLAVLDLTVVGMEKAGFKLFGGWKLDEATRSTQPYFVSVRVANRGKEDLGGRPVPLYLLDGSDRLVQSSSFATPFARCPSGGLPQKFTQGKEAVLCLVFLAPEKGELAGVTYRPTQEFSPITWRGEVVKAGGKPIVKLGVLKDKGKKKGKRGTKGDQGKKDKQKGAGEQGSAATDEPTPAG